MRYELETERRCSTTRNFSSRLGRRRLMVRACVYSHLISAEIQSQSIPELYLLQKLAFSHMRPFWRRLTNWWLWKLRFDTYVFFQSHLAEYERWDMRIASGLRFERGSSTEFMVWTSWLLPIRLTTLNTKAWCAFLSLKDGMLSSHIVLLKHGDQEPRLPNQFVDDVLCFLFHLYVCVSLGSTRFYQCSADPL